MVPSVFFILSEQSRLPLGHVLQLKLPEQCANGLLVRGRGIFAVLLLDLRNDLVDDGLRHRVAFKRRDRTRNLRTLLSLLLGRARWTRLGSGSCWDLCIRPGAGLVALTRSGLRVG